MKKRLYVCILVVLILVAAACDLINKKQDKTNSKKKIYTLTELGHNQKKTKEVLQKCSNTMSIKQIKSDENCQTAIIAYKLHSPSGRGWNKEPDEKFANIIDM